MYYTSIAMVEEPLKIEVGPRTVPTIKLLRKNLLSGEKVIFIDKNQGSVRELKKINETTRLQTICLFSIFTIHFAL